MTVLLTKTETYNIVTKDLFLSPPVLEASFFNLDYRQFLVQLLAKYGSDPGCDSTKLNLLLKDAFCYKPNDSIGSTKEHLYWPNPQRSPESSLFNSKPYRHKHGILSHTSKIISFGSCFAREIGHRLLAKGYNYYFTQKRLPSGVTDNLQTHPIPLFSAFYGILFNTLSLTYLQRRASRDPWLPKYLAKWHKNESLDLYIDPFREGLAFASPSCFEMEYEIHTEALIAALRNCDILVWTFGLSEAWVFKDNPDLAVSYGFQSFLKPLLKRKFLSYDDHVGIFQSFYSFVKGINPGCQFVISVSPVPLNATYLHETLHVIEANEISKSAIRLAAYSLTEQLEDVFYLPSYELVTRCTENPWQQDQRHVSSYAVNRVVDLFVDMFSVA